MKSTFLFLSIFLVFSFQNKLRGQCAIAQTSIIINIKSVTANPGGGCTTVFDLTYDISNNGGNKWSYLHFWDAAAYPALSYPNGLGPSQVQLNGGAGIPTPELQTVAVNYSSGTPVISAIYGPDVAVIPQTTDGITVTRTSLPSGDQRFFFTNIKVTTPSCNPLNLKADVWSAQDNNGKNVACGVTGLSVRADEPLLRGLLFCSTPRSYTVSVLTKTTRTVTIYAYKDVAPFGVFDANDQANLLDGPHTETNTGDPAGVAYNVHGPYPLPGGAGSIFNVWLVASASGISNSNSMLLTNTCSPLPVELILFTAVRQRAEVQLKWTTSTEINNRGFEVERNTSGTWETIAFVPSLATGGNSQETLQYAYSDRNQVKGVTQYRLKQTDIDGRFKYSDVRAVRGEGQAGAFTVFPNPSGDGRVNIVFAETGTTRDLQLTDMSGRQVKQLRQVTAGNFTIDNLHSGMYLLRIVVPATGEQFMQKIIVNRR